MKHRRGIDLARPDGEAVEIECTTLEQLPQWYVLAAECGRCQHKRAVDRWEIARECGKDLPLAVIERYLKCRHCGNGQGNKVLVGRLPRD